MGNALGTEEVRTRMQRLDSLIQEVERFTDPAARSHTRAIVQAILELHGAGLERVLGCIAETGEGSQGIINTLAGDELIGGLLLLYGLHPLDLETRVRQALDQVRPYLRSHGGNVELLGVVGGVVRLRMQGSCQSCPSSAMTLQGAIEEAINERAPDATGIEVEGLEERPPTRTSTFVPVEALTGSFSENKRRMSNEAEASAAAGACAG